MDGVIVSVAWWTYPDVPIAIACDSRCDKAWGHNGRPEIRMSDDPDDVLFLADDELGVAPADPGTYEGGYGKPGRPGDRHNKWCVRECERSLVVGRRVGEEQRLETLPDWSRRSFNLSSRSNQDPELVPNGAGETVSDG